MSKLFPLLEEQMPALEDQSNSTTIDTIMIVKLSYIKKVILKIKTETKGLTKLIAHIRVIDEPIKQNSIKIFVTPLLEIAGISSECLSVCNVTSDISKGKLHIMSLIPSLSSEDCFYNALEKEECHTIYIFQKEQTKFNDENAQFYTTPKPNATLPVMLLIKSIKNKKYDSIGFVIEASPEEHEEYEEEENIHYLNRSRKQFIYTKKHNHYALIPSDISGSEIFSKSIIQQQSEANIKISEYEENECNRLIYLLSIKRSIGNGIITKIWKKGKLVQINESIPLSKLNDNSTITENDTGSTTGTTLSYQQIDNSIKKIGMPYSLMGLILCNIVLCFIVVYFLGNDYYESNEKLSLLAQNTNVLSSLYKIVICMHEVGYLTKNLMMLSDYNLNTSVRYKTPDIQFIENQKEILSEVKTIDGYLKSMSGSKLSAAYLASFSNLNIGRVNTKVIQISTIGQSMGQFISNAQFISKLPLVECDLSNPYIYEMYSNSVEYLISDVLNQTRQITNEIYNFISDSKFGMNLSMFLYIGAFVLISLVMAVITVKIHKHIICVIKSFGEIGISDLGMLIKECKEFYQLYGINLESNIDTGDFVCKDTIILAKKKNDTRSFIGNAIKLSKKEIFKGSIIPLLFVIFFVILNYYTTEYLSSGYEIVNLTDIIGNLNSNMQISISLARHTANIGSQCTTK